VTADRDPVYAGTMAEDIETLQGELVVAGQQAGDIEATRSALPPAAVAAGVAATGFAAGMATVAVVRRRQVRRAAKRRSPLGRVVASRSFLVDVHVLGDRS
jgi:hypothetical protein